MKQKILFRRIFYLLILWAIINCAVFYLTWLIPDTVRHFTLYLPFEENLPLLPGFILPYILAYLQWACCFVSVSAQKREFAFYWMSRDYVAKLIIGAVFVVFPTVIVRPEIEGSGFFSQLVALIYSLDRPVNLFPSIHCLESWFCVRTAFALPSSRRVRIYRAFSLIFSALVFCSTVFVKQHYVLDILGGIAVFELSALICRFLKPERLVSKLYDKLTKGRSDEE